MLLRVGVKSGGCSGMSYTMDFEDGANVGKDDSVIEHEGFKLVCDSMSLLYLFGKSDPCRLVLALILPRLKVMRAF